MATLVRFKPQKQQELRSIPQITERLVEFGWLPTRPNDDLGEDLIVHIYFEGKATGVLFHLQAKSVTNLHERRQDETLPYRFKVKDLLYWEQFELPVVLMVWDVKLREGRWVLLHTAVFHLDRHNPGWREQKTATVYLPWQNVTDNDGLIEMRKGIGRFLFPQISRKISKLEVRLELDLSQTESGQKKLAAWEQVIKHGGQGSFEVEVEWPDGLVPWFGQYQKGLAQIGPLAFPKVFAAIVECIDKNGDISSITTEFKTVTAGLETIEMSNRHLTSSFIYFSLNVPRELLPKNMSVAVNSDINILGHDAHEAYNHLRMLYAFGTGGIVRVRFPSLSNHQLTAHISPEPNAVFPPVELIQLVDKLRTIQAKTENFFEIPFTEWSSDNIRSINELFVILTSGKTVLTKGQVVLELSFTANDQNILDLFLKAHQEGQRIEGIRTEDETSHLDLFDLEIQTGRMICFMSGKIEMPAPEFKRTVAALRPGQSIQIKLIDANVTEIFPDWFIKDAERLARKLAEKFEVDAVYLFGSLAWGEQWNPQTDIDLAVRGLAPEKFYKAIGYLERETNFPFDFVDLATAPDSLRERILQKGKLLFEQKRVAEIS